MPSVQKALFTKDYPNTINVERAKRNARIGARVAWAGWGKYITEIGTWRENGGGYDDHPAGQAIDIMYKYGVKVPEGSNAKKAFDEMARYFQTYSDELRVRYMLFYHRTWSRGDAVGAWSPASERGGITDNHYDHLHITFDGPVSTGGSGATFSPLKFAKPIPPPMRRTRRIPKGVELVGIDDQGWKKGTADKNSTKYIPADRPLTEKPKGWSNVKYCWAVMRQWGFSEQACAGVLGNLRQESQLGSGDDINPKAVQQGGLGRGIAQWSEGDRWSALKEWARGRQQNADPWSIEAQIRYIRVELVRDYPSMWDAFKKQPPNNVSVDQATERFSSDFERCGECYNERRQQYAQDYYKKFKGSEHHIEMVPSGEDAGEDTAPDPENDFTVSILPAGWYEMNVLTNTTLNSPGILLAEYINIPDPEDGLEDAEATAEE